ncbi:hypothetical protein Mapa_002387 [Marchantia paleacea]|nr:hypothetical protein Mapa_002387 [Marchantia paleacea]
MTDRQEMQDMVQVPEIARGVRRHRSDVLRRPRSVTLLNLSPPGSVSKDMLSIPKDRNSPKNEAMAPVSSSAPHVLGTSHRDYDKEDGLSAYLHGTTEKRPRERFRSFVDSASAEDEDPHETEMDKNGKSIVYSRRGEGEKRPGDSRDYKGEGERRSGGRDDGREYKRDDRREGHRYEGKFIRKRDGRDGRDSRDRRSDERDGNWRPSKYSRDRDRDHDDSDGEHGKSYGREEKKRTERSWKEIAERDRFLKDNRERGRDFFSSAPSERRDRADREPSSAPSDKKERIDRDKSQHSSEKVTKPGDARLPTKLKLKVGGISKVLHSDGPRSKQESLPPGFESKSSEKPSEKRSEKLPEPAKKRRHRLILQDNSDDDDYDPRAVVSKKQDNVSPSTPLAKIAHVGDSEPNEDRSNRSVASPSAAEASTPSVRKSSRIPKKKFLEDFADDIPEDTKMDTAEGEQSPVEEVGGKSREEDDEDFNKGGDASDKDASVSEDLSDDMEEEDRPAKAKRRKSQDSVSYPGKGRNAPLTARQRTMQLGKEGDSEVGPSLIEFPSGLTHTMGGRRGREKLTEEERQVKKAEAARRRKQLVEKTAKEIQATAIQKILGQDSSRKKKEERLLKQRQEIEQGKKAAALEPATNSIRWTIKPEGTIVSFSQDIELPQIFSSTPPSYPPAREKCAAPACPNSYKYRDSRSRMPLCSLACYKTIQPHALMAS